MMMHHRLVYRAVTMSMTKIRRRGGEKTEGVHEEQRLPPRPPYCYHHRRNEMPPPAYYYVAAVAHGVSFSRQRGYLVIRPGETIDLTPNLPYNIPHRTHTHPTGGSFRVVRRTNVPFTVIYFIISTYVQTYQTTLNGK